MDLQLKPSGFCQYCGHPIKELIKGPLVFGTNPIIFKVSDKLFCKEKHEQLYRRNIEGKVKKGKRAGYGAAGSTR